jgi:hypothetical protein
MSLKQFIPAVIRSVGCSTLLRYPLVSAECPPSDHGAGGARYRPAARCERSMTKRGAGEDPPRDLSKRDADDYARH